MKACAGQLWLVLGILLLAILQGVGGYAEHARENAGTAIVEVVSSGWNALSQADTQGFAWEDI